MNTIDNRILFLPSFISRVRVLPVVLNNIIVEKYQKQVFHYFPQVPPGT